MGKIKMVGTVHYPKGDLPLYEFDCPVHGRVKSYPMGFYKKLICPHCLSDENMLQNKSD